MKITEEQKDGVTVITFDPGETVLCDLCNEDYTASDEVGGFLFSSKAVCPICAIRLMPMIQKYKEESFIKSTARKGETFRNFVYRVRREEY
jgi:hypothetical protein